MKPALHLLKKFVSAVSIVLALLAGGFSAHAQVLITQGFEGGSLSPWTTSDATEWSTVSSGTLPNANPNTGSYMGEFDSYSIGSGGSYISSPEFNLANIGSNPDSVTFWMFRDNLVQYSEYDSITIYINTTNSLTGATRIGGMDRYYDVPGYPTGTANAWNEYSFAIPSSFNGATNYIIINGTSHDGYNIFIDDISYTAYPPVCSGTPATGTVTAGQTTGCTPFTTSLSLDGATTSSSILYQWQSSTDGVTFTNIPGATGATYNVSVSSSLYYRDSLTCSASGLAAVSDSLELVYSSSPPVIATLPFFEGFENWFGSCYNNDRPDSSITLNPTYGDNSWRRDDQGSDAGWDFTPGGIYTPASTEGAHSARFHSYENFNGPGYMDLHVNLSDANTKLITFDYINQDQFSGSGLTVMIDTDGTGNNWIQLAQYASTPGWTQEAITTSIIAANAVIRFQGDGEFTSADMGIDSLNIVLLTPCTGQPSSVAISATQTSGCSEYFSTLSIPINATTGGFTYQWSSSTDGITYATISGATDISYQADITANTYFYVVVTCSNSGLSDTSAPFVESFVTPVAVYATLPFFEGFENWYGTCYNYDRPDSSITLNPTYGLDSWRRDDQGVLDAGWNDNDGTYTPASIQGAHSARFHIFDAPSGTEGDMDVHINMSTPGTKQIQFSYINQNTFSTDHLDIELSEDGGATFPTTLASYPADVSQNWQTEFITINSVAANAVIRFAGISDFGIFDLGVDSLSIIILPPCSGTPVAGTINTTQASGCSEFTPTLSLPIGTAIGGLTYQWLSSTDGITYSAIGGATNYTYQADITANTWYRAVVTCTSSAGFDTTAALEEQFIVPTATYATLPYFEGFESWIGSCYNYDRPSGNWLTNPPYGDNSWRRDDQGADAGWDGPTDGAYTPASTEGAHSARFHSSDDDGPGPGSMDLYVDLSTPGTKLITFDFINTDEDNGSDLSVMISTDSVNFTQIADYGPNSGWTQEVIATSVTAPAIIRFQANANFIFGDMGMDSLNITLLPPCSGMPVAGTFSATQTVGCTPYTDTLSIDAPTYASGISYQWQSSTDGATYTDISGATDLTYMTNINASTFYRFYVVCAVSNDTAFSTATEALYTPEVVHTATLPYFQGFENWSGGACYSFDRPDSNWIETPASGNTAWRRDDQGTDANWTLPTAGVYNPAFTEGAHSARFHNREAGFDNAGIMDLHIDLSPAGLKEITFDCIGAYQAENTLTVSLSEDSINFTSLGTINPNNSWTYEAFTTASVSPHAIIRIEATGGFNFFFPPANDIGLDSFNVFVLPPCTGMPVAGTFSNTQTTGCTPYTSNLSVDVPIVASGIIYQWQQSTDGVTFTSVPGATGTTFSASVNATTYYRFYVACTASGDTAYATATQFVLTPEVVSTASLSYFQGFENWTGTCSSFDRPDTNWVNNPNTGDGSWRRDDQGFDANWDNPDFGYDYFPTSTEGAHAARYHSYWQDDLDNGTEGDLDLHINLSAPGTKTMTFDYINDDGSDFINVELSEDSGNTFNMLGSYQSGDYTGILGWTAQSITITSVAPNAIIRFAAFGDFGNTDMGIDSLNIAGPPCDTLSNVTATNITAAGATINWTAVSGTAGYEVTIDQSSTNPAGSGTGVGTNSYTTSSLAAGTTYYAHVRDSCGPGSFSAWTTVSFTTLACDSITGLTVTNIGQTSATVSWNAVPGTAGYEIVVGSLPSTIIVATGTTNNSYLVTGLTASTVYYVIVRDSCGAGNFSAPDTMSFTTHSLGIANVNGGQFSVDAYPNPANDIVTVRAYGITGDNRKVSLTDVAGRTISVMDMTTDRVDFNMSNLAPGIYLIRYEDDAHTRIIKVNKQ